ncbi:hypothetical protein WME98_12010 [Sorangium sp. So ce296]|uniref:hypothetical protein n=1 Tax=Sorangium sp. So ce296 TaxID=3133296 RepID=UPI003F61D3C4
MESAISGRDFVLGKEFSMADVIFGGTIAYMLDVKMLEPRAIARCIRARPGRRHVQRSQSTSSAKARRRCLLCVASRVESRPGRRVG